jgi:hypothetical protein
VIVLRLSSGSSIGTSLREHMCISPLAYDPPSGKLSSDKNFVIGGEHCVLQQCNLITAQPVAQLSGPFAFSGSSILKGQL